MRGLFALMPRRSITRSIWPYCTVHPVMTTPPHRKSRPSPPLEAGLAWEALVVPIWLLILSSALFGMVMFETFLEQYPQQPGLGILRPGKLLPTAPILSGCFVCVPTSCAAHSSCNGRWIQHVRQGASLSRTVPKYGALSRCCLGQLAGCNSPTQSRALGSVRFPPRGNFFILNGDRNVS